jgi:hypothetical protein
VCAFKFIYSRLEVGNLNCAQETRPQVADRIGQSGIQFAGSDLNDRLRQQIPQVCSSSWRTEFLQGIGTVNGTPAPALAPEFCGLPWFRVQSTVLLTGSGARPALVSIPFLLLTLHR